MKIGISSKGKDLDASIDPRFGRCKYFLIVDIRTLEFVTIVNENETSYSGAGINAAQIVVNQHIKTLITGNIGPNAFKTLSAAGIKIYTDASGSIKEVIKDFKNGKLKETEKASVISHFGIQGGK